MNNKNIEQYLRENREKDIMDFSLRTYIEKGHLMLYIHPQKVSGETADYEVHGDQLFIRINPQSDG